MGGTSEESIHLSGEGILRDPDGGVDRVFEVPGNQVTKQKRFGYWNGTGRGARVGGGSVSIQGNPHIKKDVVYTRERIRRVNSKK